MTTSVTPVLKALENLNHAQLSGVIERAHELIEQRQAERRKAELVIQLNNIFKELDALKVDYWFGMPTDEGETELFFVDGEVRIDDEGDIIIE